jgi:hypothetical protein
MSCQTTDEDSNCCNHLEAILYCIKKRMKRLVKKVVNIVDPVPDYRKRWYITFRKKPYFITLKI